MVVRIDYKGKEFIFAETMHLAGFNVIKNKFRVKYNKIANISKPNWWYEKSDFGIFLLERLRSMSRKSIQAEPLDIETEDEWREFYPVFKYYFPTLAEYGAIKNNIAFWHSQSTKVIEDNYFIKWVVLHEYGFLDNNSMNLMDFKEMMMLYYYGILDHIFLNAEKFARMSIPPEESEEESDMYG